MKIAIGEAQRRRFLASGLALVAASRKVILGKIKRGFSIDTKADQSFVTDADKQAEKTLREGIAKLYPKHGIIGEEFPAVNADSEFQWIIDPIDGTLSFTRGIPLYGTIVALHHLGRPIVGVIDHPALDLCYYAAAGLGAFCNGKRRRIADAGRNWSVPGEIVATGDRAHFIKAGKEKAFDQLMRRHPQVRSYADCFGHTLAVGGSIGAMVDFGVKIWDIGASQVMIEEAGGKYACVQKLDRPDGALYGIILGKPKVVDWLVPLLR